MIGVVIALVIVVAIFIPGGDADACRRCGRDFDDETPTTEFQ